MNLPAFTYPAGALFFLAMIPLVILYFLKLKRPRQDVSSLVLWQSVINDQRVNSPFQKFRRNLLLLLQMLLLCLVVLALMQPFSDSGEDTDDWLPILIDTSASMGATAEGSDETRLEIVREQVRDLIEGMRSDQKIALFSFAESGRRLTEFTNDRRQLLRALDSITVTDLPSRLDDVLRVAAAYSQTSGISKVIVLTDGNLEEKVDFELPFEIDIRRVDAGGANIGITEMNARRSGAEDWEVFVRVSGSDSSEQYAQLELMQIDGDNRTVIGREPVAVSQNQSERFVFPVTTSEPTLLQARVVTDNPDSLSADNVVWLSLPAPRPLKVWVAPELYSWQHALSVLSNIQVETGGTSTDDEAVTDSAEFDVVISDTESSEGTNSAVRVHVGIIPEELSGLIESDRSRPSEIVDWSQTAPLLQHVRLGDVQISESPKWGPDVTVADLEERGYEVLIHAADGPLLLQRRRGLETDWYFLFHTDRSTLPYRIAFPILVSNITEQALAGASLSEVPAAPTGLLPPIRVESDRELTVRTPEGDEVKLISSADGRLTGAPAATVGLYEIYDGDELVAQVGTGILNDRETMLTVADELEFTEMVVEADTTERIGTDRAYWWPVALLAFGVLLWEWWYFQRVRSTAV